MSGQLYWQLLAKDDSYQYQCYHVMQILVSGFQFLHRGYRHYVHLREIKIAFVL